MVPPKYISALHRGGGVGGSGAPLIIPPNNHFIGGLESVKKKKLRVRGILAEQDINHDKIYGAGQDGRQTDTQTDRHINTMTRPGLRARAE